MQVTVPSDDPAKDLWSRVDPTDLSKIWHLFDNVPVPVGRVAEALNLDVMSTTLATETSGLIRRMTNGLYEIQVNNTDVAVRQRFTVCHEIAHYLLHRDLIDADGITDTILYRSKLSNKQEAEANRLGAAILLPWSKVLAWHQNRFQAPPQKANIDELAAAFRASSLAAGFRLGI
jgi:Zn-dependent peptidase ImmA (M78 family)